MNKSLGIFLAQLSNISLAVDTLINFLIFNGDTKLVGPDTKQTLAPMFASSCASAYPCLPDELLLI